MEGGLPLRPGVCDSQLTGRLKEEPVAQGGPRAPSCGFQPNHRGLGDLPSSEENPTSHTPTLSWFWFPIAFAMSPFHRLCGAIAQMKSWRNVTAGSPSPLMGFGNF